MHILHALFSPHRGGLENAYVYTTDALISKGHSVSALMRSDATFHQKIERIGGVIYNVQPRGFYDPIAAWKIHRIILKLKPDLIIAHNARAIALLSLAAKGTGVRVCGVCHSYKTARAMRAHYLIVLTSHMRQHFIAAGYSASRLHVIPNLIHLPEAPPKRPNNAHTVIGAAGRLVVEKGFPDLLNALHLLKEQHIPFTAYIGGQGEEAGRLHLLAEKLGLSPYIVWKGWVQDQQAFYDSLDIFCLPSLEESFGLVVLEALANGIPVVVTNEPGPVSMITHGVDGLIVPKGDSQAIAAAIKQLIDNNELKEKLTQGGWKRVQDFNFAAIAERWDNIVNSIVLSANTNSKH